MGRKKLVLKRLDTAQARQRKYSKRKIGIIKKAKELSVLCDVDLALLMFSPSGKPSLYVGQNKDLTNVIDKLANMSVEDREQRRNYTMKILKKMYANNTEVDLNSFSLDKSELLKIQQKNLMELKEKIAEKSKILSEWKNPETITDLRQVQIMENHLAVSLANIRAKKRELVIKEQEQKQGVQASQGEPIIQQQE